MRTQFTALGRGVLLGLLGIRALLTSVLILTTSLLVGIGLYFLMPWALMLARGPARYARRLARDWSGIEIPEPYLPKPPPAVPQADGWYRHDRTLYKTAKVPNLHLRLQWVFSDPATWRDLLWLLWQPVVGIGVGMLPLLLISLFVLGLASGNPLLAVIGVAGALFTFLNASRAIEVHNRWSQLLLSPTRQAVLARRVRRLTETRTEATDLQAAELRRIERDLHDAVQARLVAIGLTLGATEELIDKDGNAAKALLAKTRDASAEALRELRRVVRGIHPPVLAERGLGDAVRALALDSRLDVKVDVELTGRAAAAVEAAVYFSVCELLTNAAKHSEAGQVWIDLRDGDGMLRVTVTDDGRGGADPARGSGLNGLERRLAPFDGVLAVSSPAGGPTMASVEVPLNSGCSREFKSKLPRRELLLMGICLSIAWLPTFPQGIVAGIMKLVNAEDRSWLLALYLPEAVQWPFIVAMILIGAALYSTAIFIPVNHQLREAKRKALTL
ncbi:sensor histidine kinase [Rhizohabitans arisaemae]|uniref:sensor histidine kinase n=1 Tax=Rhizohabitans arisaemae TaxID=2720610 RepID=UPI0024B28306|nr:sensor domain-containing protein [Rhizohabitans arisaemae]